MARRLGLAAALVQYLSRHDVFGESWRLDRSGDEAILVPVSHLGAEAAFLVFTHRWQAGHGVCAA